MPDVLTASGIAACTHQGQVSLTPSQALLRAGSAFVLVEGDLANAAVAGCLNVDNPNTGALQCKSAAAPTAGASTKLQVEGKFVLLGNAQGTTQSAPNVAAANPSGGGVPTYSVSSAGQTLLKAD